jgi:uncharacterized protein YjbJ (UPF0337 family)
MNKNIIEGQWEQIKGEVQKQWGKLTNDTLDQIEGDRKKLVGHVKETYGIAQDEAEKQVQKWEDARKVETTTTTTTRKGVA